MDKKKESKSKKDTKALKGRKPPKELNIRDIIQHAMGVNPAPAKAGCSCGCQGKKAPCDRCEKLKIQAKALGLMLAEADHEAQDRLKALILADAQKNGVTTLHQVLFLAIRVHHD